MDKPTMKMLDMETGEVIDNVVKVLTKEQDTAIAISYKKKREDESFNNLLGDFIFKEDSKAVDKLETKLTSSDITKIFYLATFLDYDSYLKFDNKRKMTKGDIKDIVGINKNLFYEWYNKILKLGIIKEDENGIHMLKEYYLKGALNRNKSYNRIFIEGARQIYEDNKSTNHAVIGNIIKLLPYVNIHSSILCWNPMEIDREKLNPMTVGEISELFGYGYNNYRKLMRMMSKINVFDSHPLMLFFSDNDIQSESLILFHPLISYSGKNEDFDTVYNMFVLMSNKNKAKLNKPDYPKKLIRKEDLLESKKHGKNGINNSKQND